MIARVLKFEQEVAESYLDAYSQKQAIEDKAAREKLA